MFQTQLMQSAIPLCAINERNMRQYVESLNRQMEMSEFDKKILDLGLGASESVSILHGSYADYPELDSKDFNEFKAKVESGELEIHPAIKLSANYELLKFISTKQNKKLLNLNLRIAPLLVCAYIIIASLWTGNYYNLFCLAFYPITLITSSPKFKLFDTIVFACLVILIYLIVKGYYDYIHFCISYLLFYSVFGGLRKTIRQIVIESILEHEPKLFFLLKDNLLVIFNNKNA